MTEFMSCADKVPHVSVSAADCTFMAVISRYSRSCEGDIGDCGALKHYLYNCVLDFIRVASREREIQITEQISSLPHTQNNH